MPTDNRNNPPKPQTDKKITDLPQKKGNNPKDSQVKGGRGIPRQIEDSE